MNQEKNILPADFDGVFRFTNFSKNEFKARWNNVEYTFPALSTTPMVIPGETPEAVQSIRKKFAKELALREFYASPEFIGMQDEGKLGTPPLYTDEDLAPYIQRCLEPLPAGTVKTRVLPKDSEERYTKDAKGRNVTKILEPGESLLANGSEMV